MTRHYPVLLLLGLSATVATAQQPAAPPPIPLVTTLLQYVEDENFGKELRLTPEQVKRFVEYRKKQWDEAYTAAPAEYAKGAVERTAATAALFKEVLTADQHRRATQLAAQNAWGNLRGFGTRGGGPGGGGSAVVPSLDLTKVSVTTLRRYADIAEALKLTDEQKKLVAARSSGPIRTIPMVFLTPEQTKAAMELLGEPVKVMWNSAFDTRANTFFGGRFGNAPDPLALTEAKDVRTEIGMTDEQVKALAPVLEKWNGNTRANTRDLSPEAAEKARKELQAETDNLLAATLKPEQLTRLRQIEQQTNTSVVRFAADPVTVPLSTQLRSVNVKKALAFTPEQDKALVAADKANSEAITAAVVADGSVDDAIKLITAAHDTREKAYAAVLTAEQKKKLDEMMGKPFAGNTMPDRLNGGGGIGGGVAQTDLLKTMRTASFGQRAPIELILLGNNKSIQEELALKPEQVKKATEKYQDYTTKYGPGSAGFGGSRQDPEQLAKQRAEVSAFIGKAVGEVLTADQAKRYRELMLQRAEAATDSPRGITTTVRGAISQAGVAEAVKLTAEQKKKLIDDGEKPDEVLTADQKTAIKGMLGKKFEGDWLARPTGVPVGGGRGSPFGTTALPTTAAVLLNVSWDVFKMTPEQVTKLVPVVNEYQLETAQVSVPVERDGTTIGSRIQPVDPAKQAAADEKLAKGVADTLTPEQAKRVDQVRHQLLELSGPTNRPAYLTNAAVAKALDLKDEQRTKIEAAFTDMLRLQSAALGTSRVSPFGLGTQLEWLTKLTEKTTARTNAVLTYEQRAAWKKLTGDPVPNLPNLRFGGPGGFGGF